MRLNRKTYRPLVLTVSLILIVLFAALLGIHKEFALYQVGLENDGQYYDHLRDLLKQGHFDTVLWEYRFNARKPTQADLYRIAASAALGEEDYALALRCIESGQVAFHANLSLAEFKLGILLEARKQNHAGISLAALEHAFSQYAQLAKPEDSSITIYRAKLLAVEGKCEEARTYVQSMQNQNIPGYKEALEDALIWGGCVK